MAGALKEVASAAVQTAKGELGELSDKIWRNPELGFQEYKAHQLLTEFLEERGFKVERGFSGLQTAFRATFGEGRPNVCVICEYDALPGIGHACGHNLIAEAGIAAGLGVKAALEKEGAPAGTLTVMGTPAEEGGGGKIFLIDNGAFSDIDVAMMVHPAPYSVVRPGFIAVSCHIASFTGKASHAATHPWEGINALDAAVMAYNSISAHRQQMKPDWRVHMIITNGGSKGNIIPDKAAMDVWVRAPTTEDLKTLTSKVETCVKAAALATGCQYSFTLDGKVFQDLESNGTLAQLYARNLSGSGCTDFLDTHNTAGSTDMGNVSHVVPSIHPMFKIGTGEVYHTRDFAAVTNTPASHNATLVVAESMAHTCIDILTDKTALEAAKSEFTSYRSSQ